MRLNRKHGDGTIIIKVSLTVNVYPINNND